MVSYYHGTQNNNTKMTIHKTKWLMYWGIDFDLVCYLIALSTCQKKKEKRKRTALSTEISSKSSTAFSMTCGLRELITRETCMGWTHISWCARN